MRHDIRWQLLIAALGIGLAISVLGFQLQQTGLCSTRVPATGGRLAEGVIGQPKYLNPLLSDGNPVDAQLSSLIFDGLTRFDEDGLLVPALARDWQIAEEGRLITFELKDDVRWHDGQPFTADDVAFTYGLLQADNFPAADELRELWQSVVITATNETTVQFRLPQAYSPFLAATTRGVLPSHLLGDVPPDEIADHQFNRAPIGTGPFAVVPEADWQQTGSLRLIPNPFYWREGVQLDGIEYRFFPDSQQLAQAFADGEIQAISSVPETELPDFALLPDMRLFTSGAPSYTQLLFNLTDAGSEAIRTLAVRQALAHALDREAIIDETLAGQGLPLEGPYLPNSWAYNPALLTAYHYQPDVAAALLDEAGWVGGQESPRQKDDQVLSLTLLSANDQESRALAEAIAGYWQRAGTATELELVEPAELVQSLSERAYDVALVTVQPGNDPDLYDFWSQEAIINGQNYGGWNQRRASEALETARQLSTVDERRPYYEAFLKFYDEDLPALTLYQHVQTYGLSEAVYQADVGRIDNPRERYQTFAQWFMRYKDVAVECPDPSLAS